MYTNSEAMQPARFICDARCLHHQLLFRTKKQNKCGRAGKKPAKLCLPATVSKRPRALFSVLWRARLLENSQARAGGAFERGSNWIRMPEHCYLFQARRALWADCLLALAAICSLDFLALVRPSLWLAASQTGCRLRPSFPEAHYRRRVSKDAEWNCAQRHSPGVAKKYYGGTGKKLKRTLIFFA